MRRCAQPLAWLALPLLWLLAACGPAPAGASHPVSRTPAGTPASTPTPTPTATPSPRPLALSRCRSHQLTVAVTGSNGGAGSLMVVLAFRNSGPTACTLYGYPGAQLLSSSGAALPTTVARGGTALFSARPPALVTLPVNGTATFDLGYSDVPSGGASSCPIASRLEVTPPNAYRFLVISATIEACRGQLTVSPVYRPA